MPKFLFPDQCNVALELAKAGMHCNIDYSMNSQLEDTFAPFWESPPTNYTPGSNLEQAFDFQTAFDLVGLPYWGTFATYSGGGYVADLGITEGQARRMSRDLKENAWLDIYTRFVSLEFTTYNPNVNLFTYVLFAVEFPPIGGALANPTIQSVQVKAKGMQTFIM